MPSMFTINLNSNKATGGFPAVALIIMRLLLTGEHLVNGGQLVSGEFEVIEGLNVVNQLTWPTSAHQDACHHWLAEVPGQSHLGQGLVPLLGDFVQLPDGIDGLLNLIRVEEGTGRLGSP